MNAAHNNNSDVANREAVEGLEVMKKVDSDTANNRNILSEVLSARERAIDAGALTLQAEKFADLDEDLKAASTLVEDGNVEKAKQRRPKLIDGYKQLELATLKQGTVDQARAAIANAKNQGAKKIRSQDTGRSGRSNDACGFNPGR